MTTAKSAPSTELLRTMLSQMIMIRAFDEVLPDLYTRGLVRGSSHAAIGQEAVAVGACAALEKDDLITSTHRGHGHTIAKGADIRRMMAELLGREDGYCRGKGGSMHIADFSIGQLGANGIVGGGFGIAAGAALTVSLRNDDRAVLCFFGEGAINQASFHGVTNIAAIWRLPLILLCENNRFAMSARVDTMTAGSLSGRARAYDIPGVTVDGMDPEAVYEAVGAAAQLARGGGGPTLIVADCYRFMGHFSGDAMQYRPKSEETEWRQRDPIDALALRLRELGAIDDETVAGIRAAAQLSVAEAIEWASSCPPPLAHEALEDIYA